jgi:hypothetical protein
LEKPIPARLSAPAQRSALAAVAPIAAVILVGTALVLPRLGAQSLWLDEGLTVWPAVTATSVADLVTRVRSLDTQPPASHLVLWALGGLPHTEFFYRLPSFVAVELGIVLLYAMSRRLWGPTVGLAVAVCAQLSPYLCFYAAEARNYGLWFLCITLSAYVAVRWHEAARAGDTASSWRWALVLGVVNALGLWTHLFHAFVALAEAIILAAAMLWSARRATAARTTAASLIAAQLVTAILFAPWLLILWQAAREGAAGVPWTRPFSIGSFVYYLYAAHFGVSLGPNLRTLHVLPFDAIIAAHGLALTLGAAAIGVTAVTYVLLVSDALGRPERRWELVPLVAWPLLSLPAPLAYAVLRNFPLHPRHLLFAWPLVPIVLALGVVRFRRMRPLVVAALAVQAFALVNLLFTGYYAKDDERGAVRFAEERSGAVSYVLGDVASLYTRRTQGRLKGFLAFPADTDDVWLVDNRTWEEQNQRTRRQLAVRMRAMKMHYAGGTTAFRGIVLRHWTRPR